MPVRPTPLPMQEARKYWAGKVPMSREEFDALSDQAKARAFAVTGLSRLDQVAFVQGAVRRAIDDGEPLSDFKKRMAPVMEEQGWTGTKAWRVENIFRTNTQAAYMAGRYAQMTRVAKDRPYWRYVAVQDRRTRPSHQALNGLVYPFDHEFWNTYYPPNGFMCRCTVRTLSERQVEAGGLEVQKDLPDTILVKDPATGMETLVRPMPDKGFATNVGRDWLAGLSPSELEGDLRLVPAAALCRDGGPAFASGDEACKPPLATLDPRHILPVLPEDLLGRGLAPENYVLAFLKEFGLGGLDATLVHRLPGGIPVVIGKGFFVDKATGGWKTAWTDKGPYMRLLAWTILNPFEVWWAPVEIGEKKRLVFALHLLRLFRLPDSKEIGGYASFSLIGNQWHGATAFAPKADRSRQAILDYLEKLRGGVLMHRETLK